MAGENDNDLILFNEDGYDEDGYDKDGYDKDGYDEDGYDKNGYNEDGVDRNGKTFHERKKEYGRKEEHIPLLLRTSTSKMRETERPFKPRKRTSSRNDEGILNPSYVVGDGEMETSFGGEDLFRKEYLRKCHIPSRLVI